MATVNYKRVSAELIRRLLSSKSENYFISNLADTFRSELIWIEAVEKVENSGQLVCTASVSDAAWEILLDMYGEDITNSLIKWSSKILRDKLDIGLSDFLNTMDKSQQSAA